MLRPLLLALFCSAAFVVNGQSLNHQLDSLSNHYNTKMGAEKAEKYDQSVKSIQGKVTPLVKVGDKLPELALTTLDGQPFDLKKAIKKGPVVLVYYRGTWCPYCNMTLRNYQQNLKEFEGATIIAVSGEPAEKEKATITRNNLTYPVLHDEGLAGAKALGIAYDAGNNKQLPLGAAYVINKKGVVKYAFTETDYRRRAEVKELVANLR